MNATERAYLFQIELRIGQIESDDEAQALAGRLREAMQLEIAYHAPETNPADVVAVRVLRTVDA